MTPRSSGFRGLCDAYYTEIAVASLEVIPDEEAAMDVAEETFRIAYSRFEEGRADEVLSDPDLFFRRAFQEAFARCFYRDAMRLYTQRQAGANSDPQPNPIIVRPPTSKYPIQ